MTPASVAELIRCYLIVIADVLFQKVLKRLPPLDKIGGPVRGLVVLITGPTSGIGTETAVELGRRGAKVILACRDLRRGQNLASRIASEQAAVGLSPAADVVQLDLSSLASVEACALHVQQTYPVLHILINNAGIFDMSGVRKVTSEKFEQHMGTNHLGHFSLTMRLLPLLKASAGASPLGARIVNVSSLLHIFSRLSPGDMHQSRRFSSVRAYGSSKCAQVMFTRTLRRCTAGQNVHVFAVHPGEVLTAISQHSIPAWLFKLQQLIMPVFLFSVREGARVTVYCASHPGAPNAAAASEGYVGSGCSPEQAAHTATNDELAAFVWKWSAAQTCLPADLDPFSGSKAMIT